MSLTLVANLWQFAIGKEATNTVAPYQKSSLRHWLSIPNFYIAPLPILVRCKTKPQLELCAPLEIRILIGNYCTRWHCNFKGLAQDQRNGRNWLKIFAPLSLIKIYQMRPFLARWTVSLKHALVFSYWNNVLLSYPFKAVQLY